MATKLKNNRKFAVLIMALTILFSTGIMVGSYPMFSSDMKEEIKEDVQSEEIVNLSNELTDGIYFLYNQAYGLMDQSELVSRFSMGDFYAA